MTEKSEQVKRKVYDIIMHNDLWAKDFNSSVCNELDQPVYYGDLYPKGYSDWINIYFTMSEDRLSTEISITPYGSTKTTIKFPKGHQEVLFSKITDTIIDLIEKRQKSIEDRKEYAYTLFLNGIKEMESKNDGHNN